MYQYIKDEATGRYVRTETRIDDREYLKIKVKSLAAESKIIRQAELKERGNIRLGLAMHRRGTVRRAAREALIAYNLIRGIDLRQFEANAGLVDGAGNAWQQPDWAAIKKMIQKYGPRDFVFDPALFDGVKMSKPPVRERVARQPKERPAKLGLFKRVLAAANFAT